LAIARVDADTDTAAAMCQNVNVLMVNADVAMYHAKQAGRNGYQYFVSG